ncbi:GH11728, partial [Drosophila grimshawi]
EAASRVLRNVIGAVVGNNPAQAADSDERCSCCQPSSSMEQADDEECDYEVDNKQQLNRERRTAPRHCEPSSTSTQLELPPQTEEQQQQQTTATAESTKSSQSQSQAATQYRCFEDDFASEMFFEHFEE